ncbi:large conductance mechanosensitive channel protein MscL [Rhodococcus antarcticus]|jgi:large conductance mechanosensitive channel|uniref:Large-conductance mechanosensitive channel n=1 Tax=Rhodococcus antarcticus TaxID=2987751 RepID=A0ABY6NXJ9_9NOCA|nr:large conductance mechanosensitive channel protein MscL [Rhodococcus antarcticus]UZJ24107.1 large conductance mechanosensitive channel protein MscL [Rhodococcus antarcticus]
MLKGFKDFLLRGSVVDLAVAVVVGTAFTAIVTAFTAFIITPLISVIGGTNPAGLSFKIISDNEATRIDIGGLIGAIINFAIIAAVVYFVVVLPVNALKARRQAGVEAGPAEPTDVELLIEIRDLLAGRTRTV